MRVSFRRREIFRSHSRGHGLLGTVPAGNDGTSRPKSLRLGIAVELRFGYPAVGQDEKWSASPLPACPPQLPYCIAIYRS